MERTRKEWANVISSSREGSLRLVLVSDHILLQNEFLGGRHNRTHVYGYDRS